MSSTVSVPLSNTENILAKIEQLKEKLQTAAPGYESLLHTIHRNLINDEELVHMLKEEQIGVIFAALAKRKNIVISTSVAKKPTASSKLKNVTLDDL